MRQAPEAPENRKDFQRVKVLGDFLGDSMMVCPGVFKLMRQLLHRRNALCADHQKSHCCGGQSAD
jgi:hypothetical protein